MTDICASISKTNLSHHNDHSCQKLCRMVFGTSIIATLISGPVNLAPFPTKEMKEIVRRLRRNLYIGNWLSTCPSEVQLWARTASVKRPLKHVSRVKFDRVEMFKPKLINFDPFIFNINLVIHFQPNLARTGSKPDLTRNTSFSNFFSINFCLQRTSCSMNRLVKLGSSGVELWTGGMKVWVSLKCNLSQ